MYKRGPLKPLCYMSKSLQSLQNLVNSLLYANAVKNMDASPLKQTTYRHRKNFR